MGINKVQYGNTTLIDLTNDTVTAETLLEGYTAHDRSGAIITGTAHEGGDVPVWQGGDDYVYFSDTVTPPYEISMVDGYVVIDLPPAVLQTKTRTYTPTTSQQTDVITADVGYDGLEEVDITVNAIQTETKSATPSESAQTITPTSGKYLTSVSVGAIDSNYVGTGVTRQSAKTVTPTESSQTAVASGVYTTGAVTVGAISSTYVGSGITQRSSSDLTASGATVTVPSGYYSAQATKSVATGTAGTPTATKGAVSNHSVSVTPSVTNTGGYIDGGTKTGTAVSVSASELVSGNLAITENGTGINVANYSTVSVEVSGGADVPTFTIAYNGGNYVVTCDKTYSEAEDFYIDANYTAFVTFGDEELLTASIYERGSNYELIYAIYEEGLPFADIHYYSNGTITYTEPSGIPSGASYGYTFVASTTYEVSTTSTTAVSVGTFETGDTSIWTSEKMVYIKIRDTAGQRNGYFYGSDAFLYNHAPYFYPSASYMYTLCGNIYAGQSNGFLTSPIALDRTSSSTATLGYGIYPNRVYPNGDIDINARFSSTSTRPTGTIDGTFSVEVYLLDWPNGIPPYQG